MIKYYIMKKENILAVIMSVAMVFSLTACGSSNVEETEAVQEIIEETQAQTIEETEAETEEETEPEEEDEFFRIGFLFPGTDSDSYAQIPYEGALESLKKLGFDEDLMFVRWNVAESETALSVLEDMARQECRIIFACSPGYEEYVITAAEEYPDVEFCLYAVGLSEDDEPDNVHKFYFSEYEARFISGIAAGMKLTEILKDERAAEIEALEEEIALAKAEAESIAAEEESIAAEEESLAAEREKDKEESGPGSGSAGRSSSENSQSGGPGSRARGNSENEEDDKSETDKSDIEEDTEESGEDKLEIEGTEDGKGEDSEEDGVEDEGEDESENEDESESEEADEYDPQDLWNEPYRTIKAGYIAGLPDEEVTAGFTAFYQGVSRACPTAVMEVVFINVLDNTDLDREAANVLIENGCELISHCTENDGAALACEAAGVPFVGYLLTMDEAAPNEALTSVEVSWEPYITYAISCVIDDEPIEDGLIYGLSEGAVGISRLNRNCVADGTKDAVDEAEEAVINGQISLTEMLPDMESLKDVITDLTK